MTGDMVTRVFGRGFAAYFALRRWCPVQLFQCVEVSAYRLDPAPPAQLGRSHFPPSAGAAAALPFSLSPVAGSGPGFLFD